MKKVSWIFSVNINGMAPVDYAAVKLGPYMWTRSKKMQKQLSEMLEPGIEIDFISYNVKKPQLAEVDLLVYTDIDEKYLDEETKEKGLCLPYRYLYNGEIEEIIKTIKAHV